MPWALLIVGILLLVSAARGTSSQLFTLVRGDFTGPNNFVYWFLSIVAIGALGYFEKVKPFANAMLALVIIVLFLRRGAFFSQFTSAIQTTTTASPTSSTQPTANANPFTSLLPSLGSNASSLNIGSILTPPILQPLSLSSLPTLGSTIQAAPPPTGTPTLGSGL